MRFSFDTGRRATLGLLLTAAAATAGCDSPTDTLLRAEDPDIIDPASVNTPEAADALARGAIQRFKQMTAGAGSEEESAWLLGGLLTDEYKLGDTFFNRIDVDLRSIAMVGNVSPNDRVTIAYRYIHRARLAANLGLRALRIYRPTFTADMAELYMIRGYAEMTVAENFCNGTPLTDASSDPIVYGEQMDNEQIFEIALASIDTGLTTVGTATDAKSTLVRNTLRTLRGRILAGLDRHADAATAVAGVPTDFRYTLTFSVATGENRIFERTNQSNRYPVGNNEGQNGLPFASANDPRVPTCVGGAPGCTVTSNNLSFDKITPFTAQLLWPARDAPVAVVIGVDARLIEAEARLKAGDGPGMIGILNTLRANTSLYTCPAAAIASSPSCQANPTPLAALTDPGTPQAREDLFFREKAFWQFSRGYRLPDLRRRVRQYGRPQETVFPVGPHPRESANFGSDVNLPVPQAEQNNPNYVGRGCTDRDA